MNDIFDEYVKLSGNTAITLRFNKIFKMIKLEGKYNSIMLLLKSLMNYDAMKIDKFNELIKSLENWGYRIDRKKDIFEQLENIATRLQNLKTQIQVLDSELKKDDQKESQTIEKQLIIIGKTLELKYKLNSKEISLTEWIELNKLAYEQSNRLNSK